MFAIMPISYVSSSCASAGRIKSRAKERLDRLEAMLAALGQAGAESRQQLEQHAQQLREVIEHGEQAARRQIMAIEAEHQQTTALLEAHRNILLGAFAAQFIFMLAFIVIIVRFG